MKTSLLRTWVTFPAFTSYSEAAEVVGGFVIGLIGAIEVLDISGNNRLLFTMVPVGNIDTNILYFFTGIFPGVAGALLCDSNITYRQPIT
ncbi:hypothetical protein ATCV1_z181L [Acanthocystis turfacea chlorella virus 1]|uniref:Uncharacterized protein z181L n=1 Tax=Chlorovirus heliozoae TaxID=322019 RepID=A7K8E1_9PHYC|nr:hypothetical protein ATCV1_z181L [Acanthocystis turfacea chlorella virus 1]ABT16315.1 hypothetical protein ATCV1_z181L [Acanthocystis turfacea chlorella virus 1]